MKIHVWSLLSALKIQKMVTNLISLVPNTCKTCVYKYPKIDINHSNVPLIKFKIVLKNLLWVKTHIICSKIRYIAIFIVQIPNIYKV